MMFAFKLRSLSRIKLIGLIFIWLINGVSLYENRLAHTNWTQINGGKDTRIQFEVLENEPIGTLIGYIPTKPGFTYRFNEISKEFVLDPNTGELRTSALLDREYQQTRYNLVVLSSQPTYPIEVRIIVLDINDNSPSFPEPSIAVSFSESAVKGTRLLLDTANDRDIGKNSVSDDYSIIDGNEDGKFRLAITKNPTNDGIYLHLELTGSLDREIKDYYYLNISARDGGSPPRSGYLQVNVTVLDVNDNAPIFDQNSYVVSLNESVEPGTPILQVIARDVDLNDNSKITYYLADNELQFTIDPETGVLSTVDVLHCTQQKGCPTTENSSSTCPKSCVFTVYARDHGIPRQNGRAYVTVNLVDTNDHDPVIRFQFFPPTGKFATVDENAINGSVVAAVSISDQDEGLNGETIVKIISGNERNHFRLEHTPDFNIIRVNGVLDRENVRRYNLSIVATDRGKPPRSTTGHLVIQVNDVNDHDPVFEKSEYSVVLSELSPIGTFVASIQATDDDKGVNALLTYDIMNGNNRQWFKIDNDSGLVTTRSLLDREQQGNIELSISVHDGGPNPKWAYTKMRITILDENDEKPTFLQTIINVTMPESSPPNTLITVVRATDQDQGTNGSVSYAFTSNIEREYPDQFILNSITGEIKTRKSLDRESISNYVLQVIAKDQGTPSQSSTATINLRVTDVNDNDPVFYPQFYFLQLDENQLTEKILVKVNATDRDEGDNALISYQLENNDDGLFAINNMTGEVKLKNPFQITLKTSYLLKVSAKDHGGRKNDNNAMIYVKLLSKNEQFEFEDQSYEFQLVEDNGLDKIKMERILGKIKLRETTNIKRKIEYVISHGDPFGNFKIDKKTGIVSTTKLIDREEMSHYSLTVVAVTDNSFTETKVIVNVLDLNDNAPMFLNNQLEFSIDENYAIGQEIGILHANDKDSGMNSLVSYKLINSPMDQFEINESTGTIYLKNLLKLKPQTVFDIEVAASDNGKPKLSSRTIVSIVVIDINDHTPTFNMPSYEISLSESTPVNTRFFDLKCTDDDIGLNGKISYRIVDGNLNDMFGIFPDGHMYLGRSLDREMKDYYSLSVACYDHGLNSRNSIVPVVINVLDENDNSPKFISSTFKFFLTENQPIDTFVGKIMAIDRDLDRNAELIYMLQGSNEYFSIEPRNGYVRSRQVFDRELLIQSSGSNAMSFQTIVMDNGVERLKDKAEIIVHIIDENDNAPKFMRLPYKIEVSENIQVGSQVIRVYSLDIDDGINGEISYSISSGNEDNVFSIDAESGQIMLKKPLDREKIDHYELTVVAKDGGIKNSLSTSTNVSIVVLDENDEIPKFHPFDNVIIVNESIPIGLELIQFIVHDDDLGINSQIVFSISSGNRRNSFHINSVSGSLYLHKSLDYEDVNEYMLNITATDSGLPKLSSTVTIVIKLIDVNDNPPIFSNTAIVRQIREGISINTPIINVTATDADTGENGRIVYSITGQEPQTTEPYFDINKSSGLIYTLRDIDRELISEFKIQIMAADQPSNPLKRLTAEKIVTIIVEDINDNHPEFISMNAAVISINDIITASEQNEIPITSLVAIDKDSGANGRVTYEIINGFTNLFRIHRSTGAVSLYQSIKKPDVRYQFSVKATDEAIQSERKSSESYITLILIDDTKSGPIFDSDNLHGSVYENEPIGTSVITLSARLSDGSEIEYYITNITGNGRQVNRAFDIDKKLGILSTAISLDREAGVEVYEIEVYAIAIGNDPKTSKINVHVNIMDKNDSPPVFKNEAIEFSVAEDMVVGYVIGTVQASDPDIIGVLRYRIISGDDNKFTIDEHSGSLSLSDTVDQEVKASYLLNIGVSDGNQEATKIVNILITDVNDNPPNFMQPYYSFVVPENAPRGYQIGIVSAEDTDVGNNSIIKYELLSDWGKDVFSLNSGSGVFTLTGGLDYEKTQHYILLVRAEDMGHPSLSATATVYCNVLDLNDNSPAFTSQFYASDIYENVPIGTLVLTVQAQDEDSGPNGEIEFLIISGNEYNDFQIYENGTILTNHLLDRETRDVYNLTIIATDKAKAPEKRLSATTQVFINLLDINDFVPKFVTENETSIKENSSMNTIVTVIKAVDNDSGYNGRIDYNIISSEVVPFSLDSTDGILRVNGNLDREKMSEYHLSITANDRGDPQNSAKFNLTIHILDENDNSPIFESKHYTATIAENATIGAVIVQLKASDADDGDNGQVRFSILTGDENRDFSITDDTGVVRIAKNLNYERKSRYVLMIQVEDSATDIEYVDHYFDTAELIITVVDINDNPPIFLNSPYEINVMEKMIPPNNGLLGTLKASDADSPPFNSQVRYFLKEGDFDHFQINASNGDLSLLKQLDREYQSQYSLTVIAIDSGSPPMTGTGTINVFIQDVNDHAPSFEKKSYSFKVKENMPPNTFITRITAKDDDIGLNGKVRYTILGEKSDRFVINRDTGDIRTLVQLDREDVNEYNFILMAQDSSPTEPRASTIDLNIIVSDVNDNSPVFSRSNYDVNLPYGIKNEDFVFGASAYDEDEGKNSEVRYSLSGQHAPKFVINSVSGVIKAVTDLSKISLDLITLNIHATDGGVISKTAHTELIIHFRSSESFPIFKQNSEYKFDLPENISKGSMIAKFTATSPKNGPNGEIRYSIAGGNTQKAFDINQITGEVSIANNGLDYEHNKFYEIWITAADNDIPRLESAIKMVINVSDVNDNSPIMDKSLYDVEVLEEEVLFNSIIKMNATDIDSGENSIVTYNLVNSYNGAFEIDADTGNLFVRTPLDRETKAEYHLIVEAADQGVPSLTGSATIIVNVLDKNDNPPRFTRLYSVNVTENAEIGSFVIQVSSSDLDIGENANATYILSDYIDDKFAIDPISGNVTVTGILDREEQDEYILIVAAIDDAWRSETPLTITIQDQNDNAPRFDLNEYNFIFPELQRSGTILGQVNAIDVDKQGPNSLVFYSLKHQSELFSLDPATGRIFSKRTLRYKPTRITSSPENQYILTVLALDNGKPPLSSECKVIINVVDTNKYTPQFEENEYLLAVTNDILLNEKIIELKAHDDLDFGFNAEIEYNLIAGNGSSYFRVDKQSGTISVHKTLRSESGKQYQLTVRATDHGVPARYDEATLMIVVTGENQYAPTFTNLNYQVVIPENEQIGSEIITISATDNDNALNGRIRYALDSSAENDIFSIDPIKGIIVVKKELDYEKKSDYQLNITATDSGFKPKSSYASLTVTVTDINDNPPMFNQTEYHAFIKENAKIGTSLLNITAFDIDSPRNAIIEFSISASKFSNYFEINSNTGAISSNYLFNYEEQTVYQIQVLAKNPNSVISSSTQVIVHVTSVNEFYPHFIQPIFYFDVSESDLVGTEVGRVQASDMDAGPDGIIYYVLVGSSNNQGFTINTTSGQVFVADELDRETQNRVILTILAKNNGIIYGNDTDEAQIIITIQDGNDPPEFDKKLYSAEIFENVKIGTDVITVKAIDKDIKPQNNQFGYNILAGDENQSFRIDSQTGLIETIRLLDREAEPTFNLIIGAVDVGIPPQTGTTTVSIILKDVNDNGPTLNPPNPVGYVMENEPAGTDIMTLTATDPDLDPNGSPFTYELVDGPFKSIVSVNKKTGLVKTLRPIDRELLAEMIITIQLEDNGIPRQRSENNVTIKVMDQNDSPSSPRNVKVLVYGYNNVIPIGNIANIHPNDPDVVGEYMCKFSSNVNPQLGLKIANGCNLYSSLTKATSNQYSFMVQANDGKHRDVTSTVTMKYGFFTNKTVENTVTIHITNITATDFLTKYYQNILQLISTDLGNQIELMLYGMAESDGHLELFFAAKQHESYKPYSFLLDHFTRKREVISQLLYPSQIVIGYKPCNKNSCLNGGACTEEIKVSEDTVQINDSPSTIITSPKIEFRTKCNCMNDFIGNDCEKKLDPCLPNPCGSGGHCRRQGHDYQCICSPNKRGKHCELDRGNVCVPNQCKNGGTCRESADHKYFCLCRPGFRGINCESSSNLCRPNPCLHGGQCETLQSDYKCKCTNGRYGRHCEKTTFGFKELSFMTFPTLDATSNDIAIIFATTKKNALLVYNFGHHSGGRSDFIALEIVNGKVLFSYGGSRTAITTLTVEGKNGSVSNGGWHKVLATRNGRVMSLMVVQCMENGDYCQNCNLNDTYCYSDDIGPTGTLNFNNEYLLIGGISSADSIISRPGQVHSDDFVGCIHSVSVNGRDLDLSEPLNSKGIDHTCGRDETNGICGRNKLSLSTTNACNGFGSCIDRWYTAACQCGSNLLSPNCHNALEPISLNGDGYIEMKISEKHRRMQSLTNFYMENTIWSYSSNSKKIQRSAFVDSTISPMAISSKSISFQIRTVRQDGLLFYCATDQHFTQLELKEKKLVYRSRLTAKVDMVIHNSTDLTNGNWHNITMMVNDDILQILVDNNVVGEDLDYSGVHDFLDPYLTVLSVGGVRKEIYANGNLPVFFEGCLANFTINNEIQPFNGSGSVFQDVITFGKVYQGCHAAIGLGVKQISNPLNIGVILVIIFFVILLLAIFASFFGFRLRRQSKEKTHDTLNTLQKKRGLNSNELQGVSGNDFQRNINTTNIQMDYNLAKNIELKGTKSGPEILTKKFKDREIHENHLLQRPDIIEREIISKSPAIREDLHMPLKSVNDNLNVGSDYPEHYDLENASSIAPSDIDIVYHYKGYREGGGIRKYKTSSPAHTGVFSNHKVSNPKSSHRHSPHPSVPFCTSRLVDSKTITVPGGVNRQHQSTPLARLSPSSEVSSQHPRILTLHDISGKPLQSALLAATSSSGGVGKDILHSNSERSINSPVMSQISRQSSSASRSKNVSMLNQGVGPNVISHLGLTVDQMDRLNCRPQVSSLVTTLDVVSNGSKTSRTDLSAHRLAMHHSSVVDNDSSTSLGESDNDSFTCSEIEFDNNSTFNEIRCSERNGDDEIDNGVNVNGKQIIYPSSYNTFDSSYRSSLRTIMTEDNFGNQIDEFYKQRDESSMSTLGWDYLLNWGPNYESFMGVFKDIADLPNNRDDKTSDNLNIPSEEYV